MLIRESSENYLETILVLETQKSLVRSIDIVHALGFSKPSICVAIKRLRENGYVLMDDQGYISLTEQGREIAERMYERHRAIAQYLRAIGVSAETADTDACRIEHVLSQETFDCLIAHAKKHGIQA